MTDLLTTLDQYLTAGTPQHRLKALTDLVDAYQQAKAAPEPETVSLPPADLARLRSLAERINLDSPQALVSAIAATPPLLDRIGNFLATPAIDPAAGLPEILIRPEMPVTRTIARIGLSADRVMVVFPEKRDDFREIVKVSLGYEWDGRQWARQVSGWAKAANVAAELGHRLLAAGFWIAPPTPGVRDMIVEESFEPEHKRKVMARVSGQYEGWLVLWWARSENCYDAARRITASHYDKPVVVVPPECYDEVEDFAGQHDFYISPAAQQIIDQARAMLNAALLVQVDEVEEPESVPANGRPGRLAVPEVVEVDEELMDE